MTDATNARHVADLREEGYAIVRRFIAPEEVREFAEAVERVYAEGLQHHATYRHGNLCFEILNDLPTGQRMVLQAYWFAWIEPVLEAARRHRAYLEVLEPLLGRDIKQIANQIHWKPPATEFTSYRFHQDLKFRERKDLYTNLDIGYVTTALAIDPQDASSGAIGVIPGSHRLGYLGLSEDGPVLNRHAHEHRLREVGLDSDAVVYPELEPGDLLMWTLYTVHGSGPNLAGRDLRRLILNSYVRATDSPHRGEWAFRDGESTPLGAEPVICRFEDLHENAEPHYIIDDWTSRVPTE